MGMRQPPLGDQELEVLRYVTANAPVTVGEVAGGFGEPRQLARTTILTVMERLRRKGYLTRARDGGAYRYSPSVPQAEVLKGLVHQFVEKTLGGSLSPFVAYLAETRDLSDDELATLRKLVEDMPEEG